MAVLVNKLAMDFIYNNHPNDGETLMAHNVQQVRTDCFLAKLACEIFNDTLRKDWTRTFTRVSRKYVIKKITSSLEHKKTIQYMTQPDVFIGANINWPVKNKLIDVRGSQLEFILKDKTPEENN